MESLGVKSPWWDKIIATVLGGILLAGVIALFQMNQSVTRLEERVSSWTQIFEKRIDGFETKYDRKFDRVDDHIKELQRLPRGTQP